MLANAFASSRIRTSRGSCSIGRPLMRRPVVVAVVTRGARLAICLCCCWDGRGAGAKCLGGTGSPTVPPAHAGRPVEEVDGTDWDQLSLNVSRARPTVSDWSNSAGMPPTLRISGSNR
jgi:hypothetical protein